MVPRVGGADEEVVRRVDARQQVEEPLRVAVRELLRRDPLGLRDLRHRLAVLVGPGEEEHLLAALAVMPREDVRPDRRVRVAQVRRRVHVVDGRRDVVGHGGGQRLAAPLLAPASAPAPGRVGSNSGPLPWCGRTAGMDGGTAGPGRDALRCVLHPLCGGQPQQSTPRRGMRGMFVSLSVTKTPRSRRPSTEPPQCGVDVRSARRTAPDRRRWRRATIEPEPAAPHSTSATPAHTGHGGEPSPGDAAGGDVTAGGRRRHVRSRAEARRCEETRSRARGGRGGDARCHAREADRGWPGPRRYPDRAGAATARACGDWGQRAVRRGQELERVDVAERVARRADAEVEATVAGRERAERRAGAELPRRCGPRSTRAEGA